MTKRRRKAKKRGGGRIFPICLMLVVGVVALSTGMRSRDLKEQEQAYIEQEEALREQIAAEEKRTTELEEKKKYVGTKQYIKDVARDKLGLVDPDEVLIKESDD